MVSAVLWYILLRRLGWESCRYPIAAACRAAGWLIRQVPLHSWRGSPSCAVEDSPVKGGPFDTLTRGIDEPRFFGNCALHKGFEGPLYLRIGMFHGRGMLHGKKYFFVENVSRCYRSRYTTGQPRSHVRSLRHALSLPKNDRGKS